MEPDRSQTMSLGDMPPPHLRVELRSGTTKELEALKPELCTETMSQLREAGFGQSALSSLNDPIREGVRAAVDRLTLWLAASSLSSEQRCDFLHASPALIALDKHPIEKKTVRSSTIRLRIKYSVDCIPNDSKAEQTGDQEMLGFDDDDECPANHSVECAISYVLDHRSSETGWKWLPRSVRLTVDNVRIRPEAVPSALDPRVPRIPDTDKNIVLEELLSGVNLEVALMATQALSRISDSALQCIDDWETEMINSTMTAPESLGIPSDCVAAGCTHLGRQMTGYIATSKLLNRQWTIRARANDSVLVYDMSSSGVWQVLSPDQQSNQVLVERVFRLTHWHAYAMTDAESDDEQLAGPETTRVTGRILFTRTSDRIWEVDPLRTQLSVGDAHVRMIRSGAQIDPIV